MEQNDLLDGDIMVMDVRLRCRHSRILAAVRLNVVKFMYAENWVYAPAVLKAKRLLQACGGTILDIRAEESLSGSHAPSPQNLETATANTVLILFRSYNIFGYIIIPSGHYLLMICYTIS